MDALPEDLRTIITDTGKIAANALTKRIRSEDDAAFGRMKSKMTVVNLSADEKAKWDGIFKQVRARLTQGTFSPDLVTKLEGYAK
jgi:TRAP-type C4-dicarboxylate transport system substrate-binding protein